MANKKPTVLNVLGYQENLKDTDGLALGSGPDIILNSDGTSSFTDTLTVGDTTNFVELYDNGSLQCHQGQQRAWLFEDANRALSIYNSSALTAYIKRDGSATFSSDVTVGTLANGTIVSPTSIQVIQSGNANIVLNADGSASFAGTITIDGVTVDSVVLDGTDAKYLIDCRHSGTNVGGIYRDESGDLVLYLKNSSGDVEIELNGETGIGIFSGYIQTTGDDSYFNVNRTGSQSSTAALYLGSAEGVQKFKVGIDGSASFIGSVSIGATDTGVQLYNDGTIQSWNSGNLNTNIAASGAATFAGTVLTGDAGNYTSGAGGTALFTGDTYYAGGNVTVYKTTDTGVKNSVTNNAWEGWARANGTSDTMTLRSSIHAGGWATFTGGIKMFRTAGDASTRINIGESDTLALWQNDGNFIIGYDGSATFSGNVVSGNFSGSYIQLDQTGVLSVISSNTSGNVIQYGRPSQAPLFNVNTDGGATFADDVSVGKILSAQDIESYHPSNSLDLMALNYATLRFTDSSGNDIINLNGQNGSATFSGDISINNGSYIRIRTTGDNTSTAIQLAPNGSAMFNGDGIVRGIFTVSGTGNTSGIVVGDSGEAKINKDGSATFDGRVTCPRVDLPGGVNGNCISCYSDSTKATEVFSITSAGRGYLNDIWQVGGNALNGQGAGVQLYPSGSVQACQSAGSSTIFAGYIAGSTTKTSVINAGGDAFFSGKVTSYGDPSAGAATGSSMHGGSGFVSSADGDGFPLYRAYKTGVSDASFIATSDGTVIAGNQLQYNTDVSGNYQIKINSSGISANFYGGTDTNVIFSSNLLAGSFDLSSDVSGSYMTTDGDIILQKDSTEASNKAFRTYNATSETASITATGEAEFAKVYSPHFALEALPNLPIP